MNEPSSIQQCLDGDIKGSFVRTYLGQWLQQTDDRWKRVEPELALRLERAHQQHTASHNFGWPSYSEFNAVGTAVSKKGSMTATILAIWVVIVLSIAALLLGDLYLW